MRYCQTSYFDVTFCPVVEANTDKTGLTRMIFFYFSKQMIEKLENEAQTRQQNIDRLEQNLLSLSEELEQTKAEQERCVNNGSLHNYVVEIFVYCLSRTIDTLLNNNNI